MTRIHLPHKVRIADVLRASDLFDQLSSEELDQLSRELREVGLGRGEVLYRQGQPADQMFVIVEGCVQSMSTGPDGRLRMVGQLSDGDTLGEIALFSGEDHQATACAVTNARVLVLEREAFERLVAGRPHIMRTVLAAVSRRASRANSRIAAQSTIDAYGGGSGRVYALFSPRGGAGKTTLAINLAIALARAQPERVALMDLDLLFGDAALLLNVHQPPTLATLSNGDLDRLDLRTLASLTVQHESSVRVVVGAGRPEDGERIEPSHVQAALTGLRRQFLVIVVDCGRTFWKPAVAALEAADRLVMVCTPELTTLRDVRDCQRMLGPTMSKALYVLNHPMPATGLSRAKFEGALEHPIAVEIPYAGDGVVRTAFANGSFVQAAGKTPFQRAIDELAAKLQPPGVSRSVSPANGRPGAARTGLLGLLARHG